MYGLIYRNGYYNSIIDLYHQSPCVLPGPEPPVVTYSIGIAPIDKLLTSAEVMFTNITAGSTPHLSLYTVQFAGQLVSVMTVLMIEGKRLGNKRTVLSLTFLWALAMQIVGYGPIMPIYGIVHLIYSRTAAKTSPILAKLIRTRDEVFLDTMAPSIVVGYIIPSLLMCVSFASSILRQWLSGFWQGYPLWLMLIQYAIGLGYKQSRRLTDDRKIEQRGPRDTVIDRITEMKSLYYAYLFAFGVSAATHMATISILSMRKLFPTMFSPVGLVNPHCQDALLPSKFQSHARMEDVTMGVQNVFQYDQYIGSTAAIAWAIALHTNSRKKPMRMKHWMWLVGEVLVVSLIAGPGGALVTLIWNRDERIIGDDELNEQGGCPVPGESTMSKAGAYCNNT